MRHNTSRVSPWSALSVLRSRFGVPGPYDATDGADAARMAWWKKHYGQIGGHILAVLDPSKLLKVNDVIEHGGRGGKKRFIVTYVRGALYVAHALSGGDKGSVDIGDVIGGAPISVVRVPPAWVGVSGEARYADYVEAMKKRGHDALILPMVAAAVHKEEGFSVPTSDEHPDVSIAHSAQNGTTALFAKEATDVRAIVRRLGFVWAPSVGVWRRLHSVGTPKPTVNLHLLKHQLNGAGHKVAFNIEAAQTVEEERAAMLRRAEYMQSRAEGAARGAAKLGESAQHHAQAAGEGAASALSKLEIPGYYPTPPDIVAKVIDAADIGPGDVVLEPSAGTGALANAARDTGAQVDVIEVEPRLQGYLRSLGFPVVGTDVLTFPAVGLYDVVVMNPPFEDKQDVAHVRHAYDLLLPGGRLVAIMSEGPFFRQSKTDEAFREWLESVGGATEKLPPAKFGRAEVPTRLVVIDKADDAAVSEPPADLVRGIEQLRAAAERNQGAAGERAAALIEKAGTSRRAKARLERHQRLAKEEARRASELAYRAGNLERAAERRQAEAERMTRTAEEATEFNTALAKIIQRKVKRDAGASRTGGDAGSGSRAYLRRVQIVMPGDREYVEVRMDRDRVTVEHGRDATTTVFLADKAPDDVYAELLPIIRRYSPQGPVVLSVAEEMRKRIHAGAKRDLGATLLRTDQNTGRNIGWGAVRESWMGKRAEHELSYSVRERAGNDERPTVTATWRGDDPWKDNIKIDLTGKTADEAYVAWLGAVHALLREKGVS